MFIVKLGLFARLCLSKPRSTQNWRNVGENRGEPGENRGRTGGRAKNRGRTGGEPGGSQKNRGRTGGVGENRGRTGGEPGAVVSVYPQKQGFQKEEPGENRGRWGRTGGEPGGGGGEPGGWARGKFESRNRPLRNTLGPLKLFAIILGRQTGPAWVTGAEAAEHRTVNL